MSVLLEGVTYSIGGKTILRNVSAELEPSKLTCVLGVNGAGKTTLLKVITGELKPDSGIVTLGTESASKGWQRSSTNYFAAIPQGATAPDHLTARELVALGRFDPSWKPWRAISSGGDPIVQESLDAAGMNQLADRKLSTLSGGELQRAWIAFCLAQQKPYMLLDESLSAIDLWARRSYFDLLKSLCRAGMGVALVTHDLLLVKEFADVVLLMSGGRITYSGPPGTGLDVAIEKELTGSPLP